ncbi:MAG: cytochrome c biogenesis protein ResB [Candidatus Melainabacteria bacterium]
MKNKYISKEFTKLFSSVKLAVCLFILLAIIIFLGSCIPQEPLVGRLALIEQFGLSQYQLLKSLGLNDVFHSWWYLGIFILLALNLIVASFIKVFPRSKKAFSWPSFLKEIPRKAPKCPERIPPNPFLEPTLRGLGGEDLDCFEIPLSFSISDNHKNTEWNNLKQKLKNNNWEIKVNENDNSLISRKGAYHRLAPSLTHIGILTILFGALISLLFGFNGIIEGIPEDRFIISSKEDSQRSYILVTTSKIFHSPIWIGKSPEFEVEIGNTKRENYADGNPKQWFTELKFFSNNGDSLKATIASVNDPVSFAGIDFYQADWNRVLRLKFNNQDFEIKLDKIKLGKQKTGEVALNQVSKDLGLLFLVKGKDKNKIAVNNTRLISELPLPRGLGGETNEDGIGFSDTPKLKLISTNKISKSLEDINLKPIAELSPNQETQIGPMKFKFIGAYSKTGIQYKYSPGDIPMIIGMIILIIGVSIAFGSKKTIWAIRKNIDDINKNDIRVSKTSTLAPGLSPTSPLEMGSQNSNKDLNKNSQIIFLMGQSDRDKAAFEREFEDLKNNLS